MKTIIIRVNKESKYEIWHSRRTSNGWIYDERETARPIVWFSEPLKMNKELARQLSRYLEQYSADTINEDIGWGGENGIRFEPKWTTEFVETLNRKFAGRQVTFVPDTNDGLFIEAYEFGYSCFHGKDLSFMEYDSKFRSPYSPFRNLSDTMKGISLLRDTGGLVPTSWIEYLVENTDEDLADYLSSNQLNSHLNHIKICLPNGNLRPCLINVFEEAVEEFKQNHPGISFEQACRNKNLDVIQWYLKYGADSRLVPSSSSGRRNEYQNVGYDYEDYTQDDLDDMYRDAFDGDPSAEWNID